LLTDLRLHHLLVCNRAGDLVGVISDRDLRSTHGATAQQLMSYPPMICASDTPVTEAITFLRKENISCLPVVDHGRLCGILTTSDLVLTLQCTLQLCMRLAQVLQQDLIWSQELDKIVASLDGTLSAEQLADRIVAARRAIRQEIQDVVNVVDLRTDGLTGVSNRQELDDILGMLLAVKNRYERPFSLAIVTVDHYSRIRETCGDAVVKPLLKAVARVIDEHVRSSDFVARCRDDAFAVVLTETRLDDAEGFRQRLLATARDNSTLDVKLRITVHSVEAMAGETVAGLLARAEVTTVAEPAK
jgi:diguanylate cyclase (GGDEF)-like protein